MCLAMFRKNLAYHGWKEKRGVGRPRSRRKWSEDSEKGATAKNNLRGFSYTAFSGGRSFLDSGIDLRHCKRTMYGVYGPVLSWRSYGRSAGRASAEPDCPPARPFADGHHRKSQKNGLQILDVNTLSRYAEGTMPRGWGFRTFKRHAQTHRLTAFPERCDGPVALGVAVSS